MIYGRFGQTLTMVRRATLNDVLKLEKRRPDKEDRMNIKSMSYVVMQDEDEQRVYHLAYLRADDGFKEIADELAKLDAAQPVT